jgi:hypothetical protein
MSAGTISQMVVVVLGQIIPASANTGIHNFNVELAALGGSILEFAVLCFGVLLISSVGSTGVHKFLRQAILITFLGALFLKSYQGIATGALAIF